MFLLPKGVSLAEDVLLSKIDLPAALSKLRNSTFSGYAQVVIPSGTGFFLYIDGRLISVLFRREGSSNLQDIEAIKTTIESLVLNRDGSFSAYRLNKEIAFALLALFRGDALLVEQEMKTFDFKAFLEKIKAEQMDACLKVYTEDRAGLIFYRSGVPIGFFHDKAKEIEMSQVEVQKIVGLPGARIDVQTLKENEESLIQNDLNEKIDITKVWSVANENVFSNISISPVTKPIEATNVRLPEKRVTKNLSELHASLIGIAVSHLGKLGQVLVEKEMAKTGDPKNLLVPETFEEMLAAIEKGSKMLTSPVKIRQMQDSMRSEVACYS
ncbi:MAG: hypothetical protein HGB32_11215 [Geobacteraceae bacterium]|nr:hypothetical protein [Geobacteraceae bacterium]NTW80704.1 hypothetical protein [Geobacteraceae bacterium]